MKFYFNRNNNNIAFSALMAATAIAANAEYVCHNDAFFHTSSSSSSKDAPSKEAIASLAMAMVESFEEAYKNIDDIDMNYDKFESVSVLSSLFE